jgi:hypothetical protein
MQLPNLLFDRKTATGLLPAFATVLAALLLALLVKLTLDSLPDHTGRGKLFVALELGLLAALPAAVYLLWRRRSSDPSLLGVIGLATLGVLLIAAYLYGVGYYVFYPADLLIWSETDFLNDILKFRVGYPIYSADANNESYTYTPGSQLLTYLLVSLIGKSESIPAMRAVQLVYVTAAAAVGARSCLLLVDLGRPGVKLGNQRAWGIASFSVLFLIGTNSITNPYVYNLHNDALALLISIVAFHLMIQYAATRNVRVLTAMLFVPAVGFMVKQNLALWGGYYCIYLAFLARPISLRRLLIFGPAAFAILCATILGCHLIWGKDFVYWVFYVLSKHPVNPIHSVYHLLSVQPYLLVAFLGGAVVLRGRNFSILLGLWLMWLLTMLVSVYTGGINIMRHHMGPACVIAGIWFMAGLMLAWPAARRDRPAGSNGEIWARTALTLAGVAMLFLTLGIARFPEQPLPDDAWRYVEEIEAEFEGLPADEVLLDLGSWVYLRDGVVMKDRASPIAERGMSETGDFSGLRQRISKRRYTKILVRNFHSPRFWYDHSGWPESSGVKKLLLDNYREVGSIPAISGQESLWARYPPYGMTEISILVRRKD